MVDNVALQFVVCFSVLDFGFSNLNFEFADRYFFWVFFLFN